VIGLVIAIVLYFVLRFLFGLFDLGAVINFTLRFTRYVIVGLFGAFVLPLLFKTIGR
jgi:hypothetical protein